MVKAIPKTKTPQERHHEKLQRAGWRKVTSWLSPSAQETVQKLKDRFGSLNAGLEGILDEVDDYGSGNP